MRLIDADELRERGNRTSLLYNDFSNRLIDESPTIEAEPVKHGRWIKHKDRASWYCSECVTDDYYAYSHDCDTGVYELQDKFCPNCGARMDERESEEGDE